MISEVPSVSQVFSVTGQVVRSLPVSQERLIHSRLQNYSDITAKVAAKRAALSQVWTRVRKTSSVRKALQVTRRYGPLTVTLPPCSAVCLSRGQRQKVV